MPLIYDIGFHDGADTAYYLHRGYEVVAVEANPAAVEAGRKRFASEIARGRLTLLPVAVGGDGEATFWVSSFAEYSSFDRGNAEKFGQTATAVTVECRSLGSLIAEFGPAHYAKIDVEGADRACLESLTPETAPPYLSFEMGDDVDLSLATVLGYRRFKLVCQIDYSTDASELHWRLYRMAARLRIRHPRLARLLSITGDRRHGDWTFPRGASGPFGEDTAGRWRTAEDVMVAWRAFRAGVSALGAPEAWAGCPLAPWFDVHCAR